MFERRSVLYCIMTAIIFTIISLPFLSGMMRPNFEDKNPYALLYSFFNLPVALLLDGFIEWLAEAEWEYPTLQQLDLTRFVVSVFFWSIAGMIFGLYKDYSEG